jgi:hypothetical protein
MWLSRRTHHHRINERRPVITTFEERKNERYSGGSQKDENKLILELFQYKLPYRRGRILNKC